MAAMFTIAAPSNRTHAGPLNARIFLSKLLTSFNLGSIATFRIRKLPISLFMLPRIVLCLLAQYESSALVSSPYFTRSRYPNENQKEALAKSLGILHNQVRCSHASSVHLLVQLIE
jgi:hypothetical protein